MLKVEYDLKVTECPCGSGKLPKRCCGEVKNRTYSVELDEVNLESDGLALGLDMTLQRVVAGKLHPIIGDAKLTQSYKRKKGSKVLASGIVTGDKLFHPESLLCGFDQLFIIDTNTKDIGGHTLSVSGVIHAYVSDALDGEVKLMYLPICAFEFWNPQCDPERLGWLALIDGIQGNDELSGKKTGIVVDSSLGQLDAINNKEAPIVSDHLLPDGFNLIYASADIGVAGVNKMIKMCDWLSTREIRIIAKERIPAFEPHDRYSCSLFRQRAE